MNKLDDGFKMKKLLIICILIIGIAFISGCAEEDTVHSAENVSTTVGDDSKEYKVSAPADHGSGTPDSFVIYNEDSNNSHEVAIEIFNSDNESIIKELFILNQSERIRHPKLPIMTTPYSRLYTVKVVLDNETTDIRSIRMDPWATLIIELYGTSTDYDAAGQIIPETAGRIIPLEISVITV